MRKSVVLLASAGLLVSLAAAPASATERRVRATAPESESVGAARRDAGVRAVDREVGGVPGSVDHRPVGQDVLGDDVRMPWIVSRDRGWAARAFLLTEDPAGIAKLALVRRAGSVPNWKVQGHDIFGTIGETGRGLDPVVQRKLDQVNGARAQRNIVARAYTIHDGSESNADVQRKLRLVDGN